MVITDIKPQQKSKSRVNVFVDGEFFCGLEKITAMERRLKIGDEIDPDELTKAVRESECAAAFEKAANYLGARPRTKKEIRVYLAGKGYSDEVINAAVDKLCEYGYVDDAEYCRQYVSAYSRKFGSRRIETDLRSKGVDFNLIEDALEELGEQSEEIRRIAEKYLCSHEYNERKLIAYLLGKGFDYDQIKEGLKNE